MSQQPVSYQSGGGQPLKTSGFGVTSLVIGIIALITCFVPFAPFGLAALGLILAIIGLMQNRLTTAKGTAIAGLVINIVAFIPSLFYSLFWGMIFAVGGAAVHQAEVDKQYNIAHQADQIAVVKEFVKDLSTGDVAGAQGHCVSTMSVETLQKSSDTVKDFGAFKDVTLSQSPTDPLVLTGSATFADVTKDAKFTLLKEGTTYKIMSYSVAGSVATTMP